MRVLAYFKHFKKFKKDECKVLKEKIEKIKNDSLQSISKVSSLNELEEIRVEILGKKGELTSVLKQMGSLSADERPIIGAFANEVRDKLEEAITAKKNELTDAELNSKLALEKIDVTMSCNCKNHTHRHPLSIVENDICDIFYGMGFSVVRGPEVEYDDYNFTMLNIEKGHPARDEQDTFYVSENVVLRTQTSPVQIRQMLKEKPPIRMISPGRVYRSDTVDATHSPVFHQIEGLAVDKGISFSNLKGTLEYFIQNLFGKDLKVRFRPHHFPFTEPSAEADVECFSCHGKGCRICKGEGWIEILGCGMVHKTVLENCDIDPFEYSGFAFGLGLERIAMIKYGIDDLRLFYENDVRFLAQF